MPPQVRVHVLDRDLVVERPWGSAPRVLADGAELPRDRFGRYRLAAPDGERVVTISFDWRGLLPVLAVGDERVPLDRPLPRGAWLLLGPLLLLSLAGGGVGAGLGAGAAWAAARQLRRATTPARGWAGALCAVAGAVLLYVAVVALIRAAF
ncbi:hypothetical protein MHY85_11730 [Cellulomonas sp. ACRRI]|uniref:hypothetical protein n=1 Tax=Cellulomonas sp. ACRRI TaxID=2918188 RepID=UPI001EF19FB8|nr:hypothetical protein [Cellulomonas sp. ACRRI]MCG7286638.1 hypothetical protein [Cellulomonas sp. ACRRI]